MSKMVVKYEFIKQNMSTISALVRSGDISGRILSQMYVYEAYVETAHIKSKMERYTEVSIKTGINERSVMEAIRSMEKSIKYNGS